MTIYQIRIWDFDFVGGLRGVYDGDERWLWMYSVSLILGVSWLAFVSLLHVSLKPAMVVAFFSMDIDVLSYDDVV
uniref:Uncharacterized protein n=1 Tax=Helianthus annuus TaxID=4232 RepID=A0A251SZM7_HELAN